MIIASIAGYEIFSYCPHLVPTKIGETESYKFINEIKKLVFIIVKGIISLSSSLE